jgi:hypothetical protein
LGRGEVVFFLARPQVKTIGADNCGDMWREKAKKMNYLVVLDAHSSIGKIYLYGNNDGTVTDGELHHAILDCTEIVTDSPYYLIATRIHKKEGKSHQTLYLPHGSIIAIYQYAEKEGRPMGFV